MREDRSGKYQAAHEAPARARHSSAANLAVVEEADALGEVAALYERYRAHFGRPAVPGILKCFATHLPLLRNMLSLAESFLFVDGSLGRRHKEMIATLVSSENACPYCADSHGYFLRTLGGSAEQLAAIQAGDFRAKVFDSRDQALLAFVDKVTRSSHTVTRADTESLMEAGWNETQIAEVIHITAMFAAFNRIVNAFGLPSQHLLEHFDREEQKPQPANGSTGGA